MKFMSGVTQYLNKEDLYFKLSVNYPWRPAYEVKDICVNGKYKEFSSTSYVPEESEREIE
jgi:hypothetical protein